MVEHRKRLLDRKEQEKRAQERRVELAKEKFRPDVERDFGRLLRPTQAQTIRKEEVLHGEKEEKDSFTFLRPPRR